MPFQLWMEFFTELEKYNPKFDMESQMTSNSQNNLQKTKSKAEVITISDQAILQNYSNQKQYTMFLLKKKHID